MDHRDVIARLPVERLAALSRRSDARGLAHLSGHVGLLAVLGAWISAGATLWWLALPVHGIALAFLFTLEHETTHKTPFRSPWLNEAVGHFAGALLFLPFIWFRYFHMAHHRHTNIPGKDPELAEARPETRSAWIRHVSGLPYFTAMARQILRNAFDGDAGDYVPAGAVARVRREARILLAGYACAVLSPLWTPLLFWIWWLPLLLGQPALRLYLLAEHGRCAFVANMLENTRTTFTNRLVRFLAWNMPYHTEHHALPNVPFHQLPALHRWMRPHLAVTAPGYRAFTRSYLGHLRS